MNKDIQFNNLIRELYELRDKNPKKMEREAHESLVKLGYYPSSTTSKNQEDKMKLIVCGIILLLCLFSHQIFLYVFGFIFFIAGHFVGTIDNNGGVIFIFSHGLTGLCFMIGSIIFPFVNNIIGSNNVILYCYLIVTFLFFLIGILSCVVYCLNDRLKRIRYASIIPFCFHLVGIILTILLPYIFSILTNM